MPFKHRLGFGRHQTVLLKYLQKKIGHDRRCSTLGTIINFDSQALTKCGYRCSHHTLCSRLHEDFTVTLHCDTGVDPAFSRKHVGFCMIAVRLRSTEHASDGDKPRLADCTLIHFLSFSSKFCKQRRHSGLLRKRLITQEKKAYTLETSAMRQAASLSTTRLTRNHHKTYAYFTTPWPHSFLDNNVNSGSC